MSANRYDLRPLPPAPEGTFAAVMCAECHVFGLADAMVIVFDRAQHAAAVLCETCAQKRGVMGRAEARETEGEDAHD